MGSTTSSTTENPEPCRQSKADSRGSPTTATDVVYSGEHPSRVRWFSEVAPTGVLTGVLGEMACYYGACCLHHSTQRRGKTR
jgi:hypothetical protein